jgi:hypothetical protein
LHLLSFPIPPLDDELGNVSVLGVIDGFSFNVYGTDRTNFSAFAAGCARTRITPMLIKIHNNLRVFAA